MLIDKSGESYPSHSAIHNHFLAVHEPALIAGEEDHHLSLLNGFAEAAHGEVDFTAGALGEVVAEEVTKDFILRAVWLDRNEKKGWGVSVSHVEY